LKYSFSWQHKQKYLDTKYYDFKQWLILFEEPIARTLTNYRRVLSMSEKVQ
jgi:hypothetical protein